MRNVPAFAMAAGVLACALLPAAAPARAAEPADARFELTIREAAVPPAQRVLRVKRGQQVRLTVSSDTSGELHIHAYRKEAAVVAGRTAELAFTAHATGRFRIEWHPSGERSKSGHHGPALASLEVHPE